MSQHDGRHLAQALLFDAPLGHERLQVDEARLAEVADAVQRPQVTGHVGPDLEDMPVLQNPQDGLVEPDLVEPEKETAVRRGELQQRHAVHGPRAERRPGFGVEADQGLCGQVVARRADRFVGIDDGDGAPELRRRQHGGLLVGDGRAE